MTLTEFRAQVDAYMKPPFAIDWADACGESGPLQRAIADGVSPHEFVETWCEKYDLKPIRHAQFFECDRCHTHEGPFTLVLGRPFFCHTCAVATGTEGIVVPTLPLRR